ncbi:crossover junction endodeoxyribonuclease RuvC [Longimicrobium terrae]|uniref:Crossover junction endodeoxyribonuclease RuvC n=1 Tax=Longimicrobium terrae TaxID=1639882 RepID=A0A841H2M6_9BACT|nr:crossover junction endodeoxyribonuclease RuvC [Longimicrobium terrae]MBB6072415.1 crossover junction endodeoxyribonuclease RuvC [Longimicrobium terrae]
MIAPGTDGPAARRIPLDTVVLGVDPGTAVTGYGVVRRGADGAVSLLECGVVRTRPGGELADRLREIYEGLTEVIGRTHPGVLAVEGVFFAKNVRSAVVLGHARGVALLAGAMHGLRVAEYPPAEVKAAVVGAGRATKDQVGLMVQRHLKLKAVPKPHDAADGVAVALCHCFRGFGPAAPRLAPVSIATLAAAAGVRR